LGRLNQEQITESINPKPVSSSYFSAMVLSTALFASQARQVPLLGQEEAPRVRLCAWQPQPDQVFFRVNTDRVSRSNQAREIFKFEMPNYKRHYIEILEDGDDLRA
jgi:hypothetical protein